ncbi:spore coat protein [Lutibacter sp. B2]|nr:spore coat protein [Lutibacter sp. B2]
MDFYPSLSEKELLYDLLMSEKQICSVYNSSIIESSNSNLRQLLSQCEENIFLNQEKLLTKMNQRGWLTTTSANKHDIENLKEKFNQLIHDLH